MMVAGDMPPAAEEQVLREGLVACGLNAAGISMAYDDLVQGYVITIEKAAGAKTEHLECIETVASRADVAFEEEALGSAFIERKYARAKALWLAETKETLRKRGFLEGMPKRADFSSVEEFAAALERHCGFAAGSVLRVRNGEVVFWPENVREGKKEYERLAALMAAVTYATADSGDFKMGFVGNEYVADRP